jgi:hypothetical protein
VYLLSPVLNIGKKREMINKFKEETTIEKVATLTTFWHVFLSIFSYENAEKVISKSNYILTTLVTTLNAKNGGLKEAFR